MASDPKRMKVSDEELSIFVGSCGFGDPAPRSVLLLTLSLANGKLSCVGEPIPVGGNNPSWLLHHASSNLVYCAFEDDPGTVQAFKIKSVPGASLGLEPLGKAASAVGSSSAHLAMDKTGKWVFVANYSEGSVAVLPVLEDGSLGPPRDSKKHQGGDRIPANLHDRQEKAHCHQCLVHPSNKWMLVCDLGLSTVFVYEFNADYGALVGAADDPRHLRLDPGAGCRHAAWSNAGDRLFVNNELDCTVTVCHFDVEHGSLVATHTVPTLPPGITPLRAPHRGNSDIHVHPNGRFLYVGCRSPDPAVIAVFAINENGGGLSLVCHESTRGSVPRNFKLVGDGKWLVVGNQETKTVVSFAVDSETGKLQFASEVATSQKPCNICPVR